MTPLELLGYVTDDLEQRLEGADAYQSLRTSGLLRLLIAERRDSLLPRVAAEFGVPLAFEVHATGAHLVLQAGNDDSWGLGMHGISPRPGQETKSLTLDDFLDVPVATGTGMASITVRTIVRTAAHAFGGVHFLEAGHLWETDNRQLADFLREHDDLGADHFMGVLVTQVGHVTLPTARQVLAAAAE
jgi:hypothetical protein